MFLFGLASPLECQGRHHLAEGRGRIGHLDGTGDRPAELVDECSILFFGIEQRDTFRFPGLGTEFAFYLREGICEIHAGFLYQISCFSLQDGVSLSC